MTFIINRVGTIRKETIKIRKIARDVTPSKPELAEIVRQLKANGHEISEGGA